MTARMPPSTRRRDGYSLAARRSKPLEREPTLERPVSERRRGLITGVPQRRVYLGDRRTDLSCNWRQGVQVEPVQTPCVTGENLAAGFLGLVVQGPPDGQLGVGRKTFLMRIVTTPHDVVCAHVFDHRRLE